MDRRWHGRHGELCLDREFLWDLHMRWDGGRSERLSVV
jgi:hypothetical protein